MKDMCNVKDTPIHFQDSIIEFQPKYDKIAWKVYI